MMSELEKYFNKINGGLMETFKLKNSSGTCAIDAILNMVINSNSSVKNCLKIYHMIFPNTSIEELYNKLDKSISSPPNFGVFYTISHGSSNKSPDGSSNENSNTYIENNNIFHKYLLFIYIAIYSHVKYTSIQKADILTILRYHILYLENRKDFEKGNSAYKLNIHDGDSVAHIAKLLDIGFYQYYKWIVSNDNDKDYTNIDNYIGATPYLLNKLYERKRVGGIILKYAKKNYINEITENLNSIPTNYKDYFIIVHDYVMENGKLINDYDMNIYNDLYAALIHSYENGFICTDLVLSQYNVGFSKSSHNAYYNMLDESIQNGERVSYLPFKELIFPNGCKNLKSYINVLSRDDMINIGFYDTDNVLGFYVPEILHFQKFKCTIPKFNNMNNYSSIYGIKSRYKMIVDELEFEIKDNEDMKPKYMFYLQKCNTVLKFILEYNTLAPQQYKEEFEKLKQYEYSILEIKSAVNKQALLKWCDKCNRNEEMFEYRDNEERGIKLSSEAMIYFPEYKEYAEKYELENMN